MKAELRDIIETRQDIWQACHIDPAQQRPHISTGHTSLNDALHTNGWPLGKNIELLTHPCIGELSMLMPTLATLTKEAKWVAFIAPPFIPYEPAFSAAGIDTKKILMVHPRNLKEHLWANEQALSSGTCSAVISWLGTHKVAGSDLRRLQQAAQKHQCLHIQMRSPETAQQPSPATLRLELKGGAKGLNIHVLKQPNSWGGQACFVPHPEELLRKDTNVTRLPIPSANKHKKPPHHPHQPSQPAIIKQLVQ